MKISVITISIDPDPVLRRTLESVAMQDYADVEHIVVDGDPANRGKQLKADFPNVKFVSLPPRGIYDAINYGMTICTGDVIGNLHGGDVFPRPTVLSEIAKPFLDDNGLDFIYGDIRYFNFNNGRTGRLYRGAHCSVKTLPYGICPPHPSLYMRRKVWAEVGPYPLDQPIAGDYEMWSRLFKRNDFTSHYMSLTLVHMQTGGISTKLYNRLYANNVGKLLALRRNGIHSNALMLTGKAFMTVYNLLER